MGEWIKWEGGDQPVDDDVIVEVELRHPMFPEEEYIDPAYEWDWSVDGDNDGDIIAYRIVESA